jgi:hypothetical protein
MATSQLAVAAGIWLESSGVGSWQMMGKSRVHLRVESPAVKEVFFCAVVRDIWSV